MSKVEDVLRGSGALYVVSCSRDGSRLMEFGDASQLPSLGGLSNI